MSSESTYRVDGGLCYSCSYYCDSFWSFNLVFNDVIQTFAKNELQMTFQRTEGIPHLLTRKDSLELTFVMPG